MSKIVPTLDRLLVRRAPQEETSRGGIVIPDTAKEKPLEGEVLAVGPGRPRDNGFVPPMSVKPGDRILFGKHSGWSFRRRDEVDAGGEVFVLEERDVLGVIVP